MIFKSEAETRVSLNEREIVLVQIEGIEEDSVVWFTPGRARLVAAEMMRLADEFDARKGDAQ